MNVWGKTVDVNEIFEDFVLSFPEEESLPSHWKVLDSYLFEPFGPKDGQWPHEKNYRLNFV